MIPLSFPLIVFFLDSSLNYICASLVYKYHPNYLLGTVWLLYFSKAPVLGAIAVKLSRPQWIPSPLLYTLILCLVPPLHQTVRFLLTSQPPELHSCLLHSLLSHLPLALSCLLWDLASPYVFPSKTPSMDKNGKDRRRENFIRLVKYSKPDWLPLSLAFIFLTLALALEMSIPYYMGRVIDILSNNYKENEFLSAIFYMAFFSITSSISAGCRGGIFMFCMSRLTQRLRLNLFHALIKQDIGFFESTKTGDINSRLMQDTALVSRSIAGNVNITLRMLVHCIGHYAFMIVLSWQLTLLTFISTPLTWIVQSLYNKYHQELVKDVQDSIASSADLAKEIIESVKNVQCFAAEEEEVKRYEEALGKTHNLQMRRDLVRAMYLLAIRSIDLGAQVIMLWRGHNIIKSGEMTSGEMVSFILYQMQAGHYLRSLVHMLSEITHSAGAATKVFQYLDREPQVSTSGSLCPESLRGEFQFKKVTFSYPSRPDATTLQNVSFTLPPGSVTALVGPSGGGKTTCVSLLERFYDPKDGEILLDGRPIADYKHEYLHSKVALVAQNPVLFSGTIKDNIAYGLRDIDEQQLKTAARQAMADDFIKDMAQGYDTDVGGGGNQLGAGQKQRIAVARALALRPRLLILDEASSCLDVDTEHEMRESLQSIPGLSLLIVAHRLCTIRDADLILVLEGGQIIERGTHDELVEAKGAYHKLLQNGD